MVRSAHLASILDDPSSATNLVNLLTLANDHSARFLSLELSQALLAWYAESGRNLPWRNTADPYAIWISEIMLQQTQVKTVLPYYTRWLQQFPDVHALATAELQTVLKAWEGLGYYARARNLYRSAQIIVEQFDGQFPQNFDDVLRLPGIGRTTAGGILSSAFNRPLPILDGNVKRVLARLVALEQPPGKALDQLWAMSERLVPVGNGRDFNQALMDLGATICTPHHPACRSCPWQHACQAYCQGRPTDFPISERKKPLPHKTIGVAVIWNESNAVLIHQRPKTGLLGGLWEFPNIEVMPGRSIARAIQQVIPTTFGVKFKLQDQLICVKHTYTHFKATFHVYQCERIAGERIAATGAITTEIANSQWVKVDQLRQLPFPKSHWKMIQVLQSG